MEKISKSPDRHTFQKNSYIERQTETNEELDSEYVAMFDQWRENDLKRESDPKWQKNNLEFDLRTTEWILDKVRSSNVYAQNLYAAMCNNDFQKLEVMPILKDEKWSCSWRHAGGIIADMRKEGDYIDWYCSGMGGVAGEHDGVDGFQPESTVTKEIESDLKKLGWIIFTDL
jgi:hypothetical protein